MSSSVEGSEEDLTRKQRREQARANRKAMEEAEAAGAARRKRLTQLGIVIGIVVAVIVVIVVATGGSSKKGIPTNKKEANQNVSAVSSLLQGIPQSGNALGSSTAPVTLVYFGDLECPVCQQFTLGALPGVIQKYVKPGKVRIEYRSLETATREPETFRTQQVAALAAGKQQRMWDYIELFYHEQGQEDSGYVSENYLQGLASQVPGLNLATWSSDRSDPTFANTVTSDAQAANQQGFTGTPSFLIGKTGAPPQKLENPPLTEPSGFEAAINKLLKA